jgi:hypothetical protein
VTVSAGDRGLAIRGAQAIDTSADSLQIDGIDGLEVVASGIIGDTLGDSTRTVWRDPRGDVLTIITDPGLLPGPASLAVRGHAPISEGVLDGRSVWPAETISTTRTVIDWGDARFVYVEGLIEEADLFTIATGLEEVDRAEWTTASPIVDEEPRVVIEAEEFEFPSGEPRGVGAISTDLPDLLARKHWGPTLGSSSVSLCC